ncbi:MAG TPA: tyrosine-type recombinase/integrase [Candidatus Acidoferrum sp.]|jgi:site-specific recombinase XerD|nr:tyrosine-type recombinase/integrase [Candidatus Acidoferrum sp.]
MTETPFPKLLHAFFHYWLVEQRNASRHTVISYRDTWRLFLRYAATAKNKPVARLQLSDLTAAEILGFLKHCEDERKVSIGTRNCRLAALHSFFSFLMAQEPLVAAQCSEVLRIPVKRGARRELSYLETNEIAAILSQPDRSTIEGQRDHTLLALLYNTGARIQEALDLCPRALRLQPPAHVRLMGKGRKERTCPLWPETVHLLQAMLKRQSRPDDQPIFLNRYGEPLGAAGVRFKLKQYVVAAAHTVPSLGNKRVSPHTFRHSTAVSLVAAGVDVTVIRSWLGHVRLDTTNHYARANMETKRKALERVDKAARPGKPARWKRDADLMAWLDAL